MKSITTNKATYEIRVDVETRMAEGPFGHLVPKSYLVYNILEDGKMVRFCHDENDIEEMIAIHEGRGDNIDPIYFTGVTSG